MLFNSIEFLIFLPIVFLLYWFAFKQLRWQNFKAGADVIMLPPVCPRARFYSAFSDKIVYALKEMQYPYIVSPDLMALDDSCSFGGYHVNKEGVKQNTKHIIDAISDYITLSK